MWDCIVIGGGLAGLIAGIRAAERGKKILIISKGLSSLSYSSGAIDIGDVGQLERQTDHPYSLLRQSVVRAGMDYFQKLFPNYQGSWGSTEIMLTPLGTPKETTLVSKMQNAGPLNNADIIVLVAPEGLKDFFPDIIKDSLEKNYPKARIIIYPFKISAFDAWYTLGKPVTGMEYANYWKTPSGIAEFKKLLISIHRKIADCRKNFKEIKKAVVSPELSSSWSKPLQDILAETPFPFIELTAFPPSANGHNLYCALTKKFKSLGGELLLGSEVEFVQCRGKIAEKAIVKSKVSSSAFAARSFVLATGGILGGGIEVTPDSAQETVMGLPLFIPSKWTNAQFLSEQPYTHTGVEVDNQLRPLDSKKEIVLNNVRIAGRMLAHYDPWSNNCAGGVSLATGWFAGENI